MIVYPAVDLRDGCCVQLVGGSYDNELLRIDDPISVAQNWQEVGFDHLHIIDLDRATNNGTNINTVKEIITAVSNKMKVRVGGGIRSGADVSELLSAGASNVVIGSKGVREFDWFSNLVAEFPAKIYIALEVFEREVKVDGWKTAIENDLFSLVKQYDDLDIAGFFVTAIHKEGLRQGTDIELFTEIADLAQHNVVASGGVSNVSDVKTLDQVGVSEVVLGAALYADDNFTNELKANKYIGRS